MNLFNKAGFIVIIASIMITSLGLLYQNRIVILSGAGIFTITILFLAIYPIIFLNKNKDSSTEENILMINCPFCDNKIPSNVKKCHICGKNIYD